MELTENEILEFVNNQEVIIDVAERFLMADKRSEEPAETVEYLRMTNDVITTLLLSDTDEEKQKFIDEAFGDSKDTAFGFITACSELMRLNKIFEMAVRTAIMTDLPNSEMIEKLNNTISYVSTLFYENLLKQGHGDRVENLIKSSKAALLPPNFKIPPEMLNLKNIPQQNIPKKLKVKKNESTEVNYGIGNQSLSNEYVQKG